MAHRPGQPTDDNDKARPRRYPAWMLTGAIAFALGLLVVLLLTCLLWIPRWLYPPLTETSLRNVADAAKVQELKDARLKLQNDARTTMLQGLGAVLVLTGAGIGVSMTLRQVRATLDQISAATRASHDQLKLSEQRQFTDRYTKAVDQLDDHRAVAVRLGGLYALERIARDSPDDRKAITEVLCAFARTAPRPEPPAAAKGAVPSDPPATDATPVGTPAAEPVALTQRAPDVQAAVAILGQWWERLHEPPPVPDLHDADLRGADLGGARLQGANLRGAQLQGANLRDAQLQGANLHGAQLQGANLRDAQLQGAVLHDAQLQRANLDGAQLRYALLAGAQLQQVDLNGAQLQRADLRGAQLQRAKLGGAQLQGANLGRAQLRNATLDGAQLEDAQLQDADLWGARLQDADLAGAQLQDAILDDAKLQRATLDGAQLQRAKLWRTELQHASLYRAQLRDASLAAAQLQDTDLDDAKLHDAWASEATGWPAGWDSDRAKAAGVRFVDRPQEPDARSLDQPGRSARERTKQSK
jgi:uncharacterized protein YjbI with pentapeptide repeats